MRQTDVNKNTKIKETFLATKAKRETQTCHVRTVKIQDNKLNKWQREWLNMCFVEAKWLYNHVLSLSENGNNVFSIDYTNIPVIQHFDKDRNPVFSELTHLPAQCKQEVVSGIKTSIRALAAAKKQGNDIGKLNFISDYTSINLKQYNVSYRFVGNSKIKLSGCKKPFKVCGLDQIKSLGKCDFANAKLLHKASGYYIAITCYVKTEQEPNKKPLLGIDLGCMTSVTCSDGKKYNCTVEESGYLKTLQRKLAKAKKDSNNCYKLKMRIRKEYEKLDNKKNDAARQVVAKLKPYKVIMQDEQLKAWKEIWHGKKVQHGILGRVKNLLIDKPDTVVLSRWIPTTKMCTECGEKIELSQKDRTFVCPHCGYTGDRDVHAAQNMIWFYRNIVGVERTDYKLADFEAAVSQLFKSLKQEAAKSLA